MSATLIHSKRPWLTEASINQKKETPMQIGSERDYRKPIIRKLIPSLTTTYHYTRDSYPSLIIGSCGSGRTRTVLSMLKENLANKQPFVYINGQGDTQAIKLIYDGAKEHGVANDLYCLNAYPTEEVQGHTFDPINPLVGDEMSFEAIFGGGIGSVINEFCMLKHLQGAIVDFETLKSFLNLEIIKKIAFSGEVKPLRLSSYLQDIEKQGGSSEDIHDQRCKPLVEFISVFKDLPMCSFNPDLDFKSVFTESKFLVVNMPAIEKDPDAIGIIGTLISCHIAKQVPGNETDTICPSVVFDSGFIIQNVSVAVIRRLEKTKSIFAYEYMGGWNEGSYVAYDEIANMTRSFIAMRCESDITNAVKLKAFEYGVSRRNLTLRDIHTQQPGMAYIWGEFDVITHGLFNREAIVSKLIGLSAIRAVYYSPPHQQEFSLTKKPLKSN